MDNPRLKVITQRLLPVPRSLELADGDPYQLADGCQVKVRVHLPDTDLAQLLHLAKSFWNITPHVTLTADPELQAYAREEYGIQVTPTVLELSAQGWDGLLNAMKTLRQLAEVNRGTATTQGYFLAPCRIHDAPALDFRGIHLCIFPETPLWDIEKSIRIAAYHKVNVAVIECWGNFPFQSHPDIRWPQKSIPRQELKRLITLGRELGITLVPQLNILGHAAMARGGAGKHAILDFNPALQPLFEPDGWCWCLTNPHTRALLTDLALELHEFFDRPPFFHLGCDEAHTLGTCRECLAHPLADLVTDHITYFHDLLKKHGAQSILWHDMLLRHDDPRWKGFIAFGTPEQNLEQVVHRLPKDLIVADWQYSFHPQDADDTRPEWPTMKFFQEQNFRVLGCPWTNRDGIVSIGKFLAQNKMMGMLETSWHTLHGDNHEAILALAPSMAWNPDCNPNLDRVALRFAHTTHLRQVGWDMNITAYDQSGWNMEQVNRGDLA